MRILFNGCSVTHGDELEEDKKEEQRFSRLIANHYGAEDINLGCNGNSNDAIARTTIDWLLNNPNPDKVIIQWTATSRIEGYQLFCGKEQYVFVTTQTPRKWEKFYAHYYHPQLGVDCLWKNYYLLEQLFIERGIDYYMFIHDDWRDNQIYRSSAWKKMIKKLPRYVYRSHDLNYPGDPPRGNHMFDILLPSEYQVESKYMIPGGGHPSIEGHQEIARKLIEDIK